MEAQRKRYSQNGREDKGKLNQQNYVRGTVLQSFQTYPEEEEGIPLRRRPLTEEEFRKQRRNKQSSRERLAEKRKREQVRSIDFTSMLFLSAAIGVVLYVCIGYLKVQSDITSLSKESAVLESQLVSLQNENNAALERINTSIDLAYIYKTATKELGMVHPKQSQVISYDSVNNDYVRKLGEIPEAKDKTLIDKLLD